MDSKELISWFEIPAGDLRRAQRFYGELLHTELKIERMGLSTMAVFPHASGVGGCLTSDSSAPGAAGSVVYLKVEQDIDDVLDRVSALGGRVILCKTACPGGMGFYAHILDTEGNRVGLHGMN
jgi:predicted enzyme related to lactoylglutathione lyase